MRFAYISGPMSAPTILEYHQNIERARFVMKKYLLEGFAVYCPHTNTAYLDGLFSASADGDHHSWMEMDKELIRRCDLVIFMKGWSNSKGARIEMDFCKEINKPFIFDGEML